MKVEEEKIQNDLLDIYRNPVTGDPESDHIFAVMKQALRKRFPNFHIYGPDGSDAFKLFTGTECMTIRVQVTKVKTCSVCGREYGWWDHEGWEHGLNDIGECGSCQNKREMDEWVEQWGSGRGAIPVDDEGVVHEG